MVAWRARRPFSLDLKLPDLDGYLPAGRSVCEIRLLVVEPDHRRTRVIAGLPRQLAAPAIVTIALPRETSAEELGEQLEREGHLLSYRSGYLVTRNWIQIGLMGDCSPDRLAALLRSLARLV